jgi:hypothetical protein
MTTKDQAKVAAAKARAESLPAVRRSQIASAAAAVRWGKPAKAIYVGNFEEKFGVDVECYVLDDPAKTAMISQTGMARVLGLSPRGNSFPSFITSRAMAASVSGDLRRKLENTLKFQWGSGGGGAPPTTVNGFDTSLLIDICNAIIAAEAKGSLKAARYKKIVQQAHIIVGASAKSGIRQLVYALAGYSPSTEEVIAAFKLYIQEEAKKYEREFPNELYEQWQRLYGIAMPDRGKPWHFKHLTIRHIYTPLAQSNGKLLELLRALRANDGGRRTKLFQFLNEIGARALRIHLGRVLEMSESSKTAHEYERKIADRFGGEPELDLVIPEQPSTALPPPCEQSQSDVQAA